MRDPAITGYVLDDQGTMQHHRRHLSIDIVYTVMTDQGGKVAMVDSG